jgi:hypothetical protein
MEKDQGSGLVNYPSFTSFSLRSTSVGMGCASLSDPPALYPFGCCLLGVVSHRLDSCDSGRCRGHRLESQAAKEEMSSFMVN